LTLVPSFPHYPSSPDIYTPSHTTLFRSRPRSNTPNTTRIYLDVNTWLGVPHPRLLNRPPPPPHHTIPHIHTTPQPPRPHRLPHRLLRDPQVLRHLRPRPPVLRRPPHVPGQPRPAPPNSVQRRLLAHVRPRALGHRRRPHLAVPGPPPGPDRGQRQTALRRVLLQGHPPGGVPAGPVQVGHPVLRFPRRVGDGFRERPVAGEGACEFGRVQAAQSRVLREGRYPGVW